MTKSFKGWWQQDIEGINKECSSLIVDQTNTTGLPMEMFHHLAKLECKEALSSAWPSWKEYSTMKLGLTALWDILGQTVEKLQELSGKICPREVPREIRHSRGAQPQGKVWLSPEKYLKSPKKVLIRSWESHEKVLGMSCNST